MNGAIRSGQRGCRPALYSFSNSPRPLYINRKMYRDPPLESGGASYGNIMFDRRVVRGSTFASQPMQEKWNPYFSNAKVLAQTCVGESQASRQEEARRRAIARRRAQIRRTKEERYRVGTPPPLKGRLHENVQTEKYLEEIFDRPPVSDIGCQTDLFVDRPESPVYVPAKTGRDVETQIYHGDLFDFDIEVAPILEVLVGKTLEQAMIEVLEEDELSAIRAQQRRQMDLTSGAKAEQQRMEELEQKLEKEKELRLQQHREALLLQKETEERVAAAMLTHGYLAELLPSVLESLKEDGYLIDDIKADVDQCFLPWLIHEVQKQMEYRIGNQDILTEIVRDILKSKGDAFQSLGEMELAPIEPSLEEPLEEQTASEEHIEDLDLDEVLSGNKIQKQYSNILNELKDE